MHPKRIESPDREAEEETQKGFYDGRIETVRVFGQKNKLMKKIHRINKLMSTDDMEDRMTALLMDNRLGGVGLEEKHARLKAHYIMCDMRKINRQAFDDASDFDEVKD